MQQPDQKELFEVLEKQKKNQLQVDRIFKIVLPIVAFLLSVICANFNWQSTLGTFVILTVTFIAVGVKRLPLWHWLIVITIYCLVDNYLSYGQLDVTHLRLARYHVSFCWYGRNWSSLCRSLVYEKPLN